MEETRQTPRYLSVLLAHPSNAGSVLGLVLLWFSLGSSLLPRSSMMQGIVGALSFAFGYGIGVLIWFLVKSVAKGASQDLSSGSTLVRGVLGGVLAAILIVAVVRWPTWQSGQRLLVGLEEIGLIDGLMAVVWIVGLTAVLLFLGRSLFWLIWRLDVFNGRHMSVHIARGVTTLIIVGIFGSLFWFISSGGLAGFANARFGPGDDTTLDGITQPQNPEVSGSPDSLVEWEDLGFQGRTFAGAATTTDDMAVFHGDDGEKH